MTLSANHTPAEMGAPFARLLRPSEIHSMTGISKEVIYAAFASGELPALDLSRPAAKGKKQKPVYYIDPADFKAWLEAKKTRTGGK